MSRIIIKDTANNFKRKTIPLILLLSLLGLLLIAFSSFMTSDQVDSEGRVLYTAVFPSEIRPNSVFRIIATVEKAPSPTRFIFTITHGVDQIIISNYETIKEQQQTSIFLKIPALLPTWRNYSLKVKVFPDGQDPSEESSPLTISYVETTLIIQTDKSIYKPNELIQYRVLLLDRRFQPLDPPRNISVAIRDPDGNIIHAISNQPIPSKRGFISDKLKLSSRTKTGEWKIQAFIEEGTTDSSSSPAPSYSTIIDAPKSQNLAPIYTESKVFYVQKRTSSKVILNMKISPSYVSEKFPKVTAFISPVYSSLKPVFFAICSFSLKRLNVSGYEKTTTFIHDQGPNSKGRFTEEFNTKTDLQLQSHEIANEPTLAITAFCVERYTGSLYEETIEFKMFKYPYRIQLISDREVLKPSMNHTVRIRITFPHNNKLILDGEQIQIQYVRKDQEQNQPAEIIRRSSEGEFLYTFFIEEFHLPGRYISLIVTYKELNQTFDLKLSPKSYFEKYLVLSINQNLSSLSITEEEKDVSLEIKSTFNLKGLSIIGLSNGDIVYNNYLTHSELESNGYFIPIRVPKRVGPSMTFIAYTVDVTDEFIVSDVSNFNVLQARRMDVNLTLSTLKSEPGNNITISVKGFTNSIIGLRAVDESVVEEDKADDDFSATRLISAGYRFEGKRKNAGRGFKGDNTERDMISCGLTLIGNVKKGREREKSVREEDEKKANEYIKVKQSVLSYESFGCKYMAWIKRSWFCVEPSKPIAKSSREVKIEMNESQESPANQSEPEQQEIKFHNNILDTWIWEEVESAQNGFTTLQKTVPPSMNSWKFSAFQINQGGIGFSRDPEISLEVTTPFLLFMEIPYSIEGAALLDIEVYLYNNQNTSSSFNITLQIENARIIFVNDMGARQVSESITVDADSFSLTIFKTSSFRVGTEKLTVTALKDSTHESVVISKPLVVKPEGIRVGKGKAFLIDLRDSRTFSGKVVTEFPYDRVEGAGEDTIQINVVGDSFESLVGSLEKLLLLPSVSCEQNMAKFVSNIIILDELAAIGPSQYNLDLYNTAIENLQTGYQNQLNFLRADGSFSTLGNSDAHGPMWLTANVVKSFIKATKYVTIDEKVISRALQYLAYRQRLDGSFAENKTDDDLLFYQNSISVTAFVLLAFKSAQDNEVSKLPNGKPISKIIADGAKYLNDEREDRYFTIRDTALVAYVLSELNIRQSSTFLNKLKPVARTNKTLGLMYWNIIERAGDEYDEKLYSVETTGYAFMAFIGNGELADSFDIARWLFNKINSHGEYVSFEDTLVGISALAKFVRAQGLNNSSIEMRLDVFLNANEDEEPFHTLYIGERNRTTLQEYILHIPLDEFYIRASGNGVAFCTITWSYYTNQIESTGTYFTITVIPSLTRTGMVFNWLVCTAMDANGDTTRAIIEVTSPPGFEFDEQRLDFLKDRQFIKEWELYDNDFRVYLYLNSVNEAYTCFNLLTTRTNEVTNRNRNLRGYAKVYDYYAPRRYGETFYFLSDRQQKIIVGD